VIKEVWESHQVIGRAPGQRLRYDAFQYTDDGPIDMRFEPKASDYTSAADVTAAYLASKLTREQATKILIEKGWARSGATTAPAVPTGQ